MLQVISLLEYKRKFIAKVPAYYFPRVILMTTLMDIQI